jgi:soluble lytic murein transglycosylase-like protein
MFSKIATFLLLVMLSSFANAFSVDWIVNHTKGKVSHSTAMRIVSAVHKHSFIHQVDPDIIFKIIQNESTYMPYAKARTSNATGLMQVIPRWHRDKIKGRNLRNIDVNVEVGVSIYKEYLDRSNGNVRKALWRYNASKTKKQYAEKVLRTKDKSIIVPNQFSEPMELALNHTFCSIRPIECRTEDS